MAADGADVGRTARRAAEIQKSVMFSMFNKLSKKSLTYFRHFRAVVHCYKIPSAYSTHISAT